MSNHLHLKKKKKRKKKNRKRTNFEQMLTNQPTQIIQLNQNNIQSDKM